MNATNVNVITRMIIWLFAFVAVTGAQGQVAARDVAASLNPELIGKLTNQLKVTPQQATGGAGAIFGLAKSRMNPADFTKLAGYVPGMDGLLKAAPVGKGDSVLGSLGSLAPGNAGGLASLAGSFKSLGLSPAMAGKFVPVLQNYVQAKGGSTIAGLFAGALK